MSRVSPARVFTAATATLVALLVGAATAAAAGSTGIVFEESTTSAGITAVHTGGGTDPWFPEMMGSGACLFDADGDGYEDLFIGNGEYRDTAKQTLYDPTSHFYLNAGDGTFTEATAASGLAVSGYTHGCSAADYNGDGCLDLYVQGYDLSYLFRNACDGTFVDVTAASGVVNDQCDEDENLYACNSHSSAWADYDLDGDLDLYVANYVELNQTVITFNSPGPYPGQFNAMYRNNGDGTFTDVAHTAGLAGEHGLESGKSLGVAWQDWNNDGWPDVYVANDETHAYLYQNNGDGTFTDVAPQYGVDYLRAGMGVAWGDWDNNGCSDLIVTHFTGEMDGFIRNHCTSLADESGDNWHGINETYWEVRWGVSFVDYDNDGYRDIIVLSGGVYYTEDYPDPPDMPPMAYHNELGDPNRERTFTNDSWNLGDDFKGRSNVRGAAFGDFDFNGGVDYIAVNNHNESARLMTSSGQRYNWVQFALEEPTGKNRFGIGAVVNITVNGGFQVQQHYPHFSFESSNSNYLHFGIKEASSVDAVTVTWTDGSTDAWTNVAANGTYRLTKGGTITSDTLAPATSIAVDGTGAPAADWYLSGARLELSAVDRGVSVISGVNEIVYTLNGGPETVYTGPVDLADGTYDVTAYATDNAGNRGTTVTQTVRVDGVDPVTTIDLSGTPAPSGWHLTTPTLTLTATDATSGVERIEYRRDGGAWTTYSAPFGVADGDAFFEIRAVDEAGNEEAMQALAVKVDTLDPTVDVAIDATAGTSGWFTTDAIVTLTIADATSGVATQEYRLDGGAATPYTGPVSVAGDGLHTLSHRATDSAGQDTGWVDVDVDVDTVKPTSSTTFTPTHGNGDWKTAVTFTSTGSDATSGLAGVFHTFNSGAETETTGTVGLPEGTITVATYARDNAGLTEDAHESTFQVDGVAPVTTHTITGTAGLAGWWLSAVTVDLDATDATSGVDVTRASTTAAALAEHDGTPIAIADEGVTTLRYASEDAAGNVEATVTELVHVDTVKPTAAIRLEGEDGVSPTWWANVAPFADTSDATSGVGVVRFELDGQPFNEGDAVPEGQHTIRLFVTDVAGNDADIQHMTVQVDGVAPVTTFHVVSGGGHEAGGTVFATSASGLGFDAVDDGAGVHATWYRVDSGAWTLFTGAFMIADAGAHTVTFYSEDEVGRAEGPRQAQVFIDDVAPTLTDVTPRGASFKTTQREAPLPATAETSTVTVFGGAVFTASFTAADTAAGVADMVILWDGVEVARLDEAGTLVWEYRVQLLDAGPHDIVLRATDHVGNVAEESRTIVMAWAPSLL